MRTHREQPEGRRTGEGAARRTPPPPGVLGGGRMGPGEIAALQRSAGNRVVARLIDEERHVHGAGCGHREPDGDAHVQRALLDTAAATPGRPLPLGVRREAEAFYGVDLSPARVHDDVVAQRATEAFDAKALTVGAHVFLPPKVANDRTVVGHELSHVSSNLAGVRETGVAGGAGVAVTDPAQGSERRAQADGVAFASGASRAGPRPASRAGGGGPVVARTVNVQRVKGDEAAPSRVAVRDDAIAKLDELAKACTCKQNKYQWGRITKEVVIRYKRSYANDRSGQSLRHATRLMLNTVAAQERELREQAEESGGKGGKKPVAAQEQEIQAMLVNGHLVFASNYNQSVIRLYDLFKRLRADADGVDPEELDAGGGLDVSDIFQQVMLDDRSGQASGRGDSDAESSDDDTEVKPSAKSRGKRPAAVKDGGKEGKRRKTEAGEEAGDATGSRKWKRENRERRDRQALLKVREGFQPVVRQADPVGPDEMDLDDPGGGTGAYKRDNATLKALRAASRVTLVDISNERARDPDHRAYLAALLARTEGGEATGQVYLVHNGVGVGKVHAEQKLLQLLQNAGVSPESAPDHIHVRGTKRPCDACLALLRYFADAFQLKLVHNPNGNHYFQEAVESGVKNLSGHDGGRQSELVEHVGARLGDDTRRMYESAAKDVNPPTTAQPGLGAPELGLEGGWQQTLVVPEKGVDKSGELVREMPLSSGILGVEDSESDSEAEDSERGAADLVDRTRELRIGGKPTVKPPPVKKVGREPLSDGVLAQLRAAAGPEFWAEVEGRKKGDGKFKLDFPAALLDKIKELTTGDGSIKITIAEKLSMTTIALDKRLSGAGQSGKLSKRIERSTTATAELEAAVPGGLRALREEQRRENERTGKKGTVPFKDFESTPEFDRVMCDIVYRQGFSANSVADRLLLHQGSLSRHLQKVRPK
ncbi:DUF4157 domain-containing protein [Actinosynnema pretiosum subsp. pretiosum]|uniref:DUF4157 domain-containing protein n=1 Tax=Actinosynnema pretiosum subsp. pretiosum TaxID=103721 RepID=A0AA45R3W7_9PSEU|nr:DUF4157 domain-containing protein [Actinosynnema pretiosum subsp. pretiosum]